LDIDFGDKINYWLWLYSIPWMEVHYHENMLKKLLS